MLTCVPSCCCRVQWKWWLYTERKAGWSSFVHISKISVCNITLSVIGTFSITTKDDLKHKTLLWHPRKSIKSESQVCFACVQWSAEKRSRGAQGRSAAWSVWYAAPCPVVPFRFAILRLLLLVLPIVLRFRNLKIRQEQQCCVNNQTMQMLRKL